MVWTWVKGKRGHSSSIKQLALPRYVHKLVPKEAKVSVVGDCEFGAVAVMRQLDAWQWQYVLGPKGDTLIDRTLHNQWQRFDATIERPGQQHACRPWTGRHGDYSGTDLPDRVLYQPRNGKTEHADCYGGNRGRFKVEHEQCQADRSQPQSRQPKGEHDSALWPLSPPC